VNFFRRLALQENKLDDSSRLEVVEIARDSLTCFQASFLPARAKDLSATRYYVFVLCKVPTTNSHYFYDEY